MESIIELILNIIATIISVIGLYYTIKKDGSPSLNIFGHVTLVNNNTITVKINDYYSNLGKKSETKLNKIQSVLIEFISDSVKVIKKIRGLSLIVSAIFTFIYIIISYFDIDLLLTSYIKEMLKINGSLWTYAFAYTSLFFLIYFSIMLIITAYYSKELYYQSRIRNFVDIKKLTVLKEILTKKFSYSNFDEFPMKTLEKMMHNIVIERNNQNNRVYNNRIKNSNNRKSYIRSNSVFFDNFYFKMIVFIISINISFILIFSHNSANSYPLLSPPPSSVTQIHYEKVCKPSRNKYIINSKHWQKNWKHSAYILCNFTKINTPNGFIILNSPKITDVNRYENDRHVTVSGYVRTQNHKFYFTKYSFDSPTPKLVYIPH